MTTHRLTPPQHRLLNRLRKAGAKGIDPADCHSATLDALVIHGLVEERMKPTGPRAVLTADVVHVQAGATTRPVVQR